MAAVYGWAVAGDEDSDLVRISLLAREEGPSDIEVELINPFDIGLVILTPKQAREVARDLNAAARAAGGSK